MLHAIKHSRDSAGSVVRIDYGSQRRSLKFEPRPPPKPLIRYSPNLAYVIPSRTSIGYLSKILRRSLKGYLVTIYLKLCEPYFFFIFGGFLQLHSQGPSPIFAHNTSYDAVPRKNVLLRGQKIKN